MAVRELTIIHFNDVYNVEPPILPTETRGGGAARFSTAVRQFRHLNPLVAFSGDIFNPSLLSAFARGEQMIPVLNRLEVNVAVFGNHDFDFGLDAAMSLVSETSFPWLLSNVLNNETKRPLAEAKISYITRWNGVKLGFMGLVENDWLQCLATINPDEVIYMDFVEMGKKLTDKLRDEGCDLVIALTHMRTVNDLRLLEQCTGIDLILGGHDHQYETHWNGDRLLLKSGTDFRQFSVVRLRLDENGVTRPHVERVEVTDRHEQDPVLTRNLQKYIDMAETKLDDVLAHFEEDLEGRFSKLRTQETNLGNFVADVMLSALNADCVILNSGTLRSDRVHPAGDFTFRDLVTIAPFNDTMVLLQVKGSTVHEALENGVSLYPQLVGRFPQVAGLSFVFDPAADPGHRVDPRYIKIGDEFLQSDRLYRLGTKQYVHEGRDGYKCLMHGDLLQDAENSSDLRTSVQNHFDSVNRVRGYLGPQAAVTSHRQSIVPLSRRNSKISCSRKSSGFLRVDSHLRSRRNSLVVSSYSPTETPLQRKHSMFTACQLIPHSVLDQLYTVAELRSKTQDQDDESGCGYEQLEQLEQLQQLEQLEQQAAKLAPTLEGRIQQYSDEVLNKWDRDRKFAEIIIVGAD